MKTVLANFDMPERSVRKMLEGISAGIEWAEYNLELGQDPEMYRSWEKDVSDGKALQTLLQETIKDGDGKAVLTFHIPVEMVAQIMTGLSNGLMWADYNVNLGQKPDVEQQWNADGRDWADLEHKLQAVIFRAKGCPQYPGMRGRRARR